MGEEVVGCLTCRQRLARTRGCCPACYTKHLKAVTRGEVSWAQLEQRGLVLPAQQKNNRAWVRHRGQEGA